MKVWVKLFGTLPQRFPDYNPEHGLEVEIPDGSKVKDPLSHLELSASDSGIVAIDNLVVKADEKLKDGLCVRIFQRAFGG